MHQDGEKVWKAVCFGQGILNACIEFKNEGFKNGMYIFYQLG